MLSSKEAERLTVNF